MKPDGRGGKNAKNAKNAVIKTNSLFEFRSSDRLSIHFITLCISDRISLAVIEY